MRIGLTPGAPAAAWPDGTVLHEWTAGNARWFFAVYTAAFRERPGFPGWSAEQWIDEVTGDEDFRLR